MTPHRLYVGTIGEGLFRSLDCGRTFRRGAPTARSSSATSAPSSSTRVSRRSSTWAANWAYFGAPDGADNWTRLDGPLAGLQVWSVHVPPPGPRRSLSGLARRACSAPTTAFFMTWAVAAATMETASPAHPAHPRHLRGQRPGQSRSAAWAGVEIDGVHASRDGGRTWAPVGKGLEFARHPRDRGRPPAPAANAGCWRRPNNDLNVSDDDGRELAACGHRPRPPVAILPRPDSALRPAGKWCCSGPATGRREARGWRRTRETAAHHLGGRAGARVGQQHRLVFHCPPDGPGLAPRRQCQRRGLPPPPGPVTDMG